MKKKKGGVKITNPPPPWFLFREKNVGIGDLFPQKILVVVCFCFCVETARVWNTAGSQKASGHIVFHGKEKGYSGDMKNQTISKERYRLSLF